MNIIRRALLAITLIASPAFGQSAPPPVPALPDTDRVQGYSISASTCACAVNFALYGDNTDFQNWLAVYINNVQVQYNDANFGWKITSPTGPLGSIPRPVTDAVLTFNSVQTGTVTIVGARRPRRLSQFAENRGVAARDLNQMITDLVAENREMWYLFERTSVYEPGFFPNALPLAASRAGQFLCFDSVTGQPKTCVATTGSTTFSAGNGIALSGVSPTTITADISAGTGITFTGTHPIVISRGTGALNAQTGNYTIATGNADCGLLIVATGGQNTITLPAASAVTTGCEVGIKNGEIFTGAGTARGKKLVNFPSDFLPPTNSNNILWPNQVGYVKSNGTVWLTTQPTGRWQLPTSVELCVLQNGNDTNDGLANSASAAGCLAHVQTAVNIIGSQWDGTGYDACSIGWYAGGTNILAESVSQTGQSVGCYLTFNARAAFTWSTAGSCWVSGDGGITIINMNLGFVPTLHCNNTNLAATCQFYGHQVVIWDINGAFEWDPQGTNDCLMFMDAQGRATFGLSTAVIGTGAAASADSFFNCNSMCTGIQVSGTLAHSAGVTYNQFFRIQNGGYVNTTSAITGAPTATNPSSPRGNARLITNGTTIPGGAPASVSGGQVCANTAC